MSKTLICFSNFNPFVPHNSRRLSVNRWSRFAVLRTGGAGNCEIRRCLSGSASLSSSSPGDPIPILSRLGLISRYAESFESGGGGDGGGDGVSDGGEVKVNPATGVGVDDISSLSSVVIVLDVGGMMCEGCASSVKRILESQPQVSLASVNLAAETAIVWPVSEAKSAPNWQKKLGNELANHLTTCGFVSNLKGHTTTEGDIVS